MSLALPWEVVESVIDHSSDSVATLYSFTLTCRQLRPRSTVALLSRVVLKDREKLFSLCAVLQSKPHLQPFVRSITIPPAEFSPYPLLRNLHNLSEIQFDNGGWAGNHGFAFHPSILKCSRQFGEHIQTLYLTALRFSSFSAFTGIVLSFPRIRTLSCSTLSFVREDGAHEARTTRRLSERLELRTLIIDENVPDTALVFFREVGKGMLTSLVFATTTGHAHEPLQRSLLPSPSKWAHLSSFTLRTSVNIQPIPRIIVILNHFRSAANLREVTVNLHDISIGNLVGSLCSGSALEECSKLEKSLLAFSQPNIWFSTRRPLNIRGAHHSWTNALEKCFPVLAERCLLTLKVESSGQAGHDSSISTPIVTSADSRRIATGSEDGTIIIWDPESGRISHEWLAHPSGVSSLVFSLDGRYIVSASGCCSGMVEVWDLHHGASKATTLVDRYGELDWNTGRCVCSSSKKILIAAETGDPGGAVSHWHIWDAYTFQRLRLDKRWEGQLQAFSADGRWIVTSDPPGRSGRCLLWNVARGQLHARELRGPTCSVRAVAFNPRSTRVVILYSDCTIRVWDVETGMELLLMQEEKGMWIEAVAYSPDGKLLLSRSTPFMEEEDHNLDTVKIWDASSGALLARLDTPDKAILSACFSPCGLYVASASRAGAALIWRTSDGSCIARVPGPGGEGSEVRKVAVTPDGKWLCCGVDDGRVFFRRMCDLVPAEQYL